MADMAQPMTTQKVDRNQKRNVRIGSLVDVRVTSWTGRLGGPTHLKTLCKSTVFATRGTGSDTSQLFVTVGKLVF